MTAFSNGFEYDEWAGNWCNRCQREDTCPLLDRVIFLNEKPAEWTPGTDDLRDRYHCPEFSPWNSSSNSSTA